MSRIFRAGVLLLCTCFLSQIWASSLKDTVMPKMDPEGNRVVIIHLHGKLTATAARKITKACDEHKKDVSVKAIIVHINSTEGDLEPAEQAMKSLTGLEIPVFVLIDRAKGTSAMLSFACDGIYMVPRARIGAALPKMAKQSSEKRDEKKTSAVSDVEIDNAAAIVRAYAQSNGFRPEVGQAMVDIDAVLKNGDTTINKKGKILILTTTEALQTMPDGKALHCHGVVTGLDELLAVKKLDRAERIYVNAAGIAPESRKQAKEDDARKTDEGKKDDKRGIAPDAGDGKVIVLKFHEDFGKPMLYVFRRAFDMAKTTKDVRAIVIDMDTPGGRVDIMKEMIAITNECKVPVYLFVNDSAMSAGALYSFATQGVFMKSEAQIGSAAVILIGQGGPQALPEDIKEKFDSAIKAVIRAVAIKNGHRPEIGEAMIDSKLEVVYEDKVICKKGRLLALTAKEAAEIMPDGKPLHAEAIVNSVDELLKLKGLEKAERIPIVVTPSERIAKFIIMLSPLLTTLAVIAFVIEIRTPGFGVPGITAICLFAIVFFGHYVASMAGYEQLALIIVGVILLALEIFVIPGFGIAGILGILCMLGGFFWMLIPNLPAAPEFMPEFNKDIRYEYINKALLNFLISIVCSGTSIFLLFRFFPQIPILNRLIHQGSASSEAGFNATNEEEDKVFEGREGVADSTLRPSGIAIIDGKRVDVVAQGAFIERGTRVRVIKVKGVRIVVVPIEEQTS